MRDFEEDRKVFLFLFGILFILPLFVLFMMAISNGLKPNSPEENIHIIKKHIFIKGDRAKWYHDPQCPECQKKGIDNGS